MVRGSRTLTPLLEAFCSFIVLYCWPLLRILIYQTVLGTPEEAK